MSVDSKKVKFALWTACVIFMAVCIPGLLALNAVQSKKYASLEKEVEELERKQQDLVEQNKKLITDISVLSSSERIKNIAENELGMRKAETEEIVRVEMKDTKR